MIISRTPYRMSFFGGGTDYPTWFREHGGEVMATTIDKYCYISARELPPFFEHRIRLVYSIVENVKEVADIAHPAVRGVLQSMGIEEGLEIHHDGDLPARSGLGSSSAFTVGLVNAMRALHGQQVSKEDLANQAIHIEQSVLREPVGSQDQVSAAFGGFNHIEFARDGSYRVSPIVAPAERITELQGRLMLFFTGLSRTAADIAQTKIDNIKLRSNELRTMQQMVGTAIEIVTSPGRDLDEFGTLLDESWKLKRTLSDRISTSVIDDIYAVARRNGALGGKLLGAGGGGFLLLFVPSHLQQAVSGALKRLISVPVRFENSGSRIVLYQPNGLGR